MGRKLLCALSFFEIEELADDSELTRKIMDCIEMQNRIGKVMLKSLDLIQPDAAHLVSEPALNAILQSGRVINGIHTDQGIFNCVCFNQDELERSVVSRDLLKLRREADKMLLERLRDLFDDGAGVCIEDAGHFWYPPGGYAGWHTNVNTPGWRLYVQYAGEPDKSFFRYRDPDTGKVITAWDKQWNFRVIWTDPRKPLWHCIYSETDRYTMSYRLTRSRRVHLSLNRAVRRIKKALKPGRQIPPMVGLY